MKKTILITALLATFALAGCAGITPKADQYTAPQANSVVHVSYGIVVSVREVEIKEKTSGVGTVAGGIAGGAVGSQIGNGKGSILTTIAGVIGGAIGGQAIENAMSKSKVLEIVVKMDDTGSSIAVTEKTAEQFKVGDKIQLVGTDKNNARVTHIQ